MKKEIVGVGRKLYIYFRVMNRKGRLVEKANNKIETTVTYDKNFVFIVYFQMMTDKKCHATLVTGMLVVPATYLGKSAETKLDRDGN